MEGGQHRKPISTTATVSWVARSPLEGVKAARRLKDKPARPTQPPQRLLPATQAGQPPRQLSGTREQNPTPNSQSFFFSCSSIPAISPRSPLCSSVSQPRYIEIPRATSLPSRFIPRLLSTYYVPRRHRESSLAAFRRHRSALPVPRCIFGRTVPADRAEPQGSAVCWAS